MGTGPDGFHPLHTAAHRGDPQTGLVVQLSGLEVREKKVCSGEGPFEPCFQTPSPPLRA